MNYFFNFCSKENVLFLLGKMVRPSNFFGKTFRDEISRDEKFSDVILGTQRNGILLWGGVGSEDALFFFNRSRSRINFVSITDK
jgi:hypothetical protein